MSVDTLELAPEQVQAYDSIRAWLSSRSRPSFTMGGYAGTGKTTTISYLIRELRREGKTGVVAFCCYTGKAASVLREKLARVEIKPDYCGTIHSLMYKPVMDSSGKVTGWAKKKELLVFPDGYEEPGQTVDLIVVDEASMVNEIVWNDLCAYGVPILAVGDHGQLAPIGQSFNLMAAPLVQLTKVHRQAEGDPIIHLSMMVRETGAIPFGKLSDNVTKIKSMPAGVIGQMSNFADTLFLCGYNWTRVTINRAVREKLGFKWPPTRGDRVVCLKNNRREEIFNGMCGVIQEIYAKKEPKLSDADKQEIVSAKAAGADYRTVETGDYDGYLYTLQVLMDDDTTFRGNALKLQFGSRETLREHEDISAKQFQRINQFDYGYCLTVHKAQGSEADNVCLFEERNKHMDDETWRRCLYTGVTRAKKRLLVVGK